MKFKKLVSGLLACAMVVTSVFTGNVTTANAAAETPTAKTVSGGDAVSGDVPAPVSTYGFQVVTGDNAQVQGALDDGVVLKESPNNTGDSDLKDYTGQPKFVAGRSGKAGDYAVDTEGKHGIVLPDKQLGDNYTVSFWVKPNDLSKDKWATSLLFVGRAKPDEKWVSIAANANGNGGMTCWSHGTTPNPYGNKNITVKEGEWQMVTLVQSGTDANFYVNGAQKFTRKDCKKAMEDADQFIALATNHWDGNYTAVYDDVSVYNQALTDGQVYRLYSGKTKEKCFEDGDITVESSFAEMLPEREDDVSLKLPLGVDAEDVNASFAIKAGAAANVIELDANTGKFTTKTAGTTTIVTTVSLKDSTLPAKTKETTVTVVGQKEYKLVADYDFTKSQEGKVLDKTANKHDATIHNPEQITFVQDESQGKSVMNIAFTDDKAKQAYLDLPTSIMESLSNKEQFTIESTYARGKDAGGCCWLFCFGSNPKDSGTNYMFYCPYFSFGGNEMRAGIKNASDEKLFSTGRVLNDEEYYTVSLVFDRGDIRLYLDGAPVGDGTLESGYSIVDDIIKDGCKNDILGYIGKSCWKQDDNFAGKISSFKVYDGAMENDDVQRAFIPVFQSKFDIATAKFTDKDFFGSKNKSKDEIYYNLDLLSTYNELPVTWTSSNPNVIKNDGTVLNPVGKDETVKMTLSVKTGLLEATKEFTLTVKPADKTKLTEKIAEATTESENPFRSDTSKEEIKKLIAKENTVTSQTDIDKLISDIDKLLKKTDYSPLYLNPFTEITDDFNPAVDTLTLAPKKTGTVKKNEIPENVREAIDVSYESLATDVATVDETGKVTGRKVGYALIVTKVSAKFDKFTQEYYSLVKVDVNLSKVTAKAKAANIAKGKKTAITVTAPADVKAIGINTTYRATGAVSVDKKGNITGKSAGTGTVFVKVSAAGKSITKKVSVKVGEITGASSVKVKKSITLKVKGISGKATWSLDKKGKKLATIKNGKLTAKKAGTVTVTAKVGKVTMTKKITIKKK